MIITLIHCYSDYNKGDLGILLATIRLLREAAPGCTINAISTFEEDDPKFVTDHNVLRTKVDRLYPAVVGRVYPNSKSRLGGVTKILCDVPKLFTIFSPWGWPFRNMVLSMANREVCDVLGASDLVVSKGGSFLCSSPGVIGTVRYLRIMATLIMALRLNPKVVIWGQSLGPVHGRFCRRILNRALADVYRIILREDECISRYSYIHCPSKTTILGQDLAFSLNVPSEEVSHILSSMRDYVAVTVKRCADRLMDRQYTRVMVESIEYVVRQKARRVVIIPHVTIGDDIAKARELFQLLDDSVKDRVLLLTGDYSISALRGLYGRASLLLGTRLHSTIFALGVGTPVICIAYHGTKAQGVYRRIGLEDCMVVQEKLNLEHISGLIDRYLDGGPTRDLIRACVEKAHAQNLTLASSLVNAKTT